MDDRKKMGADKDGVIFPIAPKLSEMSDSYLQFIEKIKDTIQQQRISVVLNANASMICLYWNIGQAILQKQSDEGWGAKVIDRIAADILLEILNTCENLPSVGLILGLCNRSWHKSLGEQTEFC